MASIDRLPSGRWRVRFYDDTGRQRGKSFPRKTDARRWLDEQTAALVRGDYVDPKTARTTMEQWCEQWLKGYATRRASTVRQAAVHVRVIVAEFGPMPLSAVKPSAVRNWTAKLKAEGKADSYVYALHRRLSQVMADAVHDGIIPRNPCSRRTSPGAAKQRPYVATTEQVWGLYDAMPDHLRPAVLLGAFAGLRVAEAAALRPEDVDFMRGIITPARQWPDEPLKSDTSRTPIPIPRELALQLSAAVAAGEVHSIVMSEIGRPTGPWMIERAIRSARTRVDGLPAGFRFHDLRHYYASALIAAGLDVKVVQARLRHASAKTTLDTYGHLWPDTDESSRAAISSLLRAGESRMSHESRQ